MALVLYNIFIAVYGLLLKIASLFYNKARLFVTGRKGLLEKISKAFENNQKPVAWFHVASLGEFEQGLPVIEAFKAAYPNHFIYITFFSPSGFEQRKDFDGADLVTYLPLDSPSNARRFVSAVRPSIAIFVKYEFWYHYLNQVRNLKIPLYCVAALFTPNHVFFKAHGGFHRRMLHLFTHIFVQNEQSFSLLKKIGLNKVSISGDTRFDRVVKTLQAPQSYPLLERFKGDKKLMIIGSSWPVDMELLYPIVNIVQPHLKFVIAPHEVDEASVSKLESGLTRKAVRITDASPAEAEAAQILIINTIGMLSNIYQYGSFAYVGGAFGDGLHNILEAVTFGLPVVFGNRGLEKFPESTELATQGGAFPIDDAKGLKVIFDKLNQDEQFRARASEQCKAYIRANTGATDHVLDHWRGNYEG